MTNNLKEALIKDFKQLLQKEFTTDWKVQRMVRELEIGVMSLENVEALINQKEKESRIDELKKITKLTLPRPKDNNIENPIYYDGFRFANTELKRYKLDRIKQLKEELKEKGK